ncbi:Six-hairpin glycosidase-like protein [Aspergillus pseudodeflectus]|uniref:Six-hairpin glycosidase-like protein n=1 Tax=Aspergillus pseudodeflectus TaxID=176178 RepID=A0ABR4K9V4_9EURO
MADSIILRGQAVLENQADSSSLLQVGAFQTALLDLVESPSGRYMEQDWESYLSRSTDSVVGVVNNATKDTGYPLDRLSVGKGLFYRYDNTGGSIYRDTLTALRTSIDLQPRNKFGGLWYYVYPYWSYLDGMFSLLSFYPLYTSHLNIDNTTSVNRDLFHQLEFLWEHCHDDSTGLLLHGYDATKTASWANPSTGASPYVWGRALGWFMMGLVDVLELHLMDSQVAAWRARFVDLVNSIVDAVEPASGCWWQVISAPGREGNYIESSASAMFTYTLYKGVRLGFLQDENASVQGRNYTQVATRAYSTLVDRFVVENADQTLSYNGTVSVCSLNSTASYEYYTTQPLLYDSVLGSAAFVRASVEHELRHQTS